MAVVDWDCILTLNIISWRWAWALACVAAAFKELVKAVDALLLELLCEYQTLRHMRTASNFILFTVRTYINPFANLLQAPAAAQAMAAAIRRKHRGRLHNRGVGTEGQLRGLLEFLDTTTAAAGLETGLGDGVLPAEPVRPSRHLQLV